MLVRCPRGACASLCCRDLRDKEPLDHAPAFFPDSGLPDSAPVAPIQKGEFKLFDGLIDKAVFASGVALGTPRLLTPSRASVPHADPSFETVTATSSSSITFLSSHSHAVLLIQTSPKLGAGAPTHSIILAGDFGGLSKENQGSQKRKQGALPFSKILNYLRRTR